MTRADHRPIVAISCDLMIVNGVERALAGRGYADAVLRAGGVPVLLQPIPALAAEIAGRFDAFVFTGGDDPRTEAFGQPTHPRATPVHPDRQAFETALLSILAREQAHRPVLGVCLGMQMMALSAGGMLDQFMPETTPTHAQHWDAEHEVMPTPACPLPLAGPVRSKHRQAVADAGGLEVIARSGDGVIEGVADPRRRFYLGVQWHPERTGHDATGDALFRALVDAARNA